MKEAYQAHIKVDSIWKDIYVAPENSGKNKMHRNRYLDVQNLDKQWRLVLPETLNVEVKNLLEIEIAEGHAGTANSGIEKTMKTATNKFECLSFSQLVKQYVESCNICQRTKYLQKRPSRYITPLQLPVRPWSDRTMDFLNVLPVFTKPSLLYPNIPAGEDHIVCIS